MRDSNSDDRFGHDQHSAGDSCLGNELLSQLAGLSLHTAQLERDHPLPKTSPAQVTLFPDVTGINVD